MQAAQLQQQQQRQLEFYQQQAASALQARDDAQGSAAAQAAELQQLRAAVAAFEDERQEHAVALECLRSATKEREGRLRAAERAAARVPALQSALDACEAALAEEQGARQSAEVRGADVDARPFSPSRTPMF